MENTIHIEQHLLQVALPGDSGAGLWGLARLVLPAESRLQHPPRAQQLGQHRHLLLERPFLQELDYLNQVLQSFFLPSFHFSLF